MAYNTNISLPQDGIIHGGAVWSGTGLVFDVSHVLFIKDGKDYSSGATQITLTPADPTNGRIDVIVANINGGIGIVTGEPSATPVKPEINFETEVEISFVYVGPGALTPTDISVLPIYKENLGDPAEWNGVVTIFGGGTWALNAGIDPFAGSISMNATSVVQADRVQFTTPSPVPTALIGVVELRLKLKAPLNNHSGSRIAFYSGGVRVTDWVTFIDAGVDIWNTHSYQLLLASNALFNFSKTEVDGFRIAVRGTGTHAGFFIDNVQIHTGISVNGSDGPDYFYAKSGSESIQIPLGGDLEFESSSGHVVFDLSSGKVNMNVDLDTFVQFENGLTKTGATVKLGGPLTAATTIDAATFKLSITGTGDINNGVLEVTKTGAINRAALYVTGSGLNNTIRVIHSGGSAGIQVDQSSSGAGIQSNTVSAAAYAGSVNSANTNTVLSVLDLTRTSSGSAASGIGASVVMKVKNSSGSSIETCRLATVLDTVTSGAEVSHFDLYLLHNGTVGKKASILSTGQLVLDAYGVGTFDDTPVRMLGSLANGSIVETPLITIPAQEVHRSYFVPLSANPTAVSSPYRFIAGWIQAPAADANLTQSATTQTLGTASNLYGAHVFIVAAAAGSASGGTGLVEIEISGDSIDDTGTETGPDSEVLVADITTLIANQFVKSTKRWNNQVTITIQNASGGTHTNYSLDFNYGFIQSDTFDNRPATVDSFEVNARVDAAPSGDFAVRIIRVDNSSWEYHASAFQPSGGTILSEMAAPGWGADQYLNWRVLNIGEAVADNEGIIIYIFDENQDAVIENISIRVTSTL